MVELTLAWPGPDNKITMLRVLMVLEDYGELMFLQTVLKKIGFDVDSTQNPRKFSDSLLSMNPDILLMTAVGKRIKGLELASQVRKQRGHPKIILIRTGALGKESAKDAEIDGWIESPVAAPDLLDKIAELCNLNKQILQDKLLKILSIS
jgi:DNA-binding response OmpR family regulator